MIDYTSLSGKAAILYQLGGIKPPRGGGNLAETAGTSGFRSKNETVYHRQFHLTSYISTYHQILTES